MSLDQLQIIEAAGIGLTNLLRTQYSEAVPDMVYRHGNPIAQRIRPGKVVPSSGPNGGEGGWEFQMRTGFADTARATRDASRDFRSPRKSTADKLRVRFSVNNSTVNDLNRIDTSARIHVADMKRAASSPGVALDIVKNAMNDATMGIDQTIESLIHADENGLIGLVNGAPKDADNLFYASATSYTSSSTTARIKVDQFSFAFFKVNMYLDIYSSAGVLQADSVKINDVNEADFSFAIELTDESVTTNLDSVADNAYIYRSGEKGQGFKASFGSIFKESYTGDNWFGGVDRSASGNGHYIPVRTRVGESSVTLSNRIVDKQFRSLGYRRGTDAAGKRPTMVIGMEAVDNWRYSVKDTVTLNHPIVNDGKLQAGDDGLSYVHPAVGRVDIVTTLTARNDKLIIMYPEDW